MEIKQDVCGVIQNMSLPQFSLRREMNRVSERPGLGAEPVQVGVRLYFTNKHHVVSLGVSSSKLFFSLVCLAEEKEGACRLGPCHLQTGSTQGYVCTVQGARVISSEHICTFICKVLTTTPTQEVPLTV